MPVSQLKRLACTEVWGGNRHIDAELALPGFQGYLYSQPCGSDRGGDVVYITACGSGVIARICLADVTGHGDQVAQISEWLQEVLRVKINHISPVRVFNELNSRIVQRGLEAMATALCISYNAFLRRLHLCHAGHPFILKYSVAEDRWRRLFPERTDSRDEGFRNAIFGVSPRVTFDLVRCDIAPGDRVVLFSDGVLDAPAPAMELFGERRLLDLLHQHRHASDRELVSLTIEAIKAFAAQDPMTHDDVTVMALTAENQPRLEVMWQMMKNRMAGLRCAILGGDPPLAGARRAGDGSKLDEADSSA